jgi:hypothetical protein
LVQLRVVDQQRQTEPVVAQPPAWRDVVTGPLFVDQGEPLLPVGRRELPLDNRRDPRDHVLDEERDPAGVVDDRVVVPDRRCDVGVWGGRTAVTGGGDPGF